MVLKQLLAKNIPVSADALVNPELDLKTLLQP
jgi:hypothetical protein